MKLIALTALLALAPQDDAKIRGLIEKLDDDRVEVREQAEQDLVNSGASAVPQVAKAAAAAGDRPELRLRAERVLQAIDLREQVATVYREPKPVTIASEAQELGKVLDEIARQAAVTIDASAVDRTSKISIDVKDAPLFSVLDRLCQGQNERTYEYFDDRTVRFIKDRHPPCPAAYAGAVRVRAAKVRVERATDFKTVTVAMQVTLQADHEKHLKPSRKCDVEISKAFDDKGAVLEVKPGMLNEDELVNRAFGGARVRINGRMAGAFAPGQDVQDFSVKSISPDSRSVTIHGNARLSFLLAPREVRFGRVSAGETREAGDFTFRVESAASASVTVNFKRNKPDASIQMFEDVARRLETGSATAIDDEGREHKADTFTLPPAARGRMNMVQFDMEGQPSGGVSYAANFSTIGTRAIKELRFRFIDRTYVKSEPFELTLPAQ